MAKRLCKFLSAFGRTAMRDSFSETCGWLLGDALVEVWVRKEVELGPHWWIKLGTNYDRIKTNQT